MHPTVKIAPPLGVNNAFLLSKCDVWVQQQILRHHKFQTVCCVHMHTLTPHILALPIKSNSTCCYREVDGEGSYNNTFVPWNCLLPVIPHSCLKRDWHICSDREAVRHSTFWQRPFSAQHSRLSKWNLRGGEGPVSRQCHDKSVSTFRPHRYAGH